MASPSLRTELLVRVFSGSAQMVGVCMAGISLFHILNALGRFRVLGDDLLAADALLFLLACFAAFWALRTGHPSFGVIMEKLADTLFLLALTLMVLICGLLVYAVAHDPT